jgi:peptidoglycan hydrolase CwlO-like protein
MFILCQPKGSRSKADSNLNIGLSRKVERLSQQINAFLNRISGIEQQPSTLGKDFRGLHDDISRNNKESLDQIHFEMRNLQTYIKKIDRSITETFGKIKLKKKEKKGKQKGKAKKKK